MAASLTDLRSRWGLGDNEIAFALKATRSGVRRWLSGTAPSAEQAEEIDRLAEFCDRLHDLGVEPGAFMSDRIVDGYTATGWLLYVNDLADLILACVSGEITPEQLLAEHDGDWRRTYWTCFKAVRSDDGGVSIVGKSYDDVVRQVKTP